MVFSIAMTPKISGFIFTVSTNALNVSQGTISTTSPKKGVSLGRGTNLQNLVWLLFAYIKNKKILLVRQDLW